MPRTKRGLRIRNDGRCAMIDGRGLGLMRMSAGHRKEVCADPVRDSFELAVYSGKRLTELNKKARLTMSGPDGQPPSRGRELVGI